MEGVLYATIAPLLPGYVADLRLSEVKAGLLVGAYPVGTLLATVPAAWFSKSAPKRSLLIGLTTLALASFTFGFAHAYGLLISMRLVQGFGGGFAWVGGLALLFRSAPAGQKGAVIGGVLSAAIVGLMIGPLLGGAASEIGTQGVFAAIAAVCLGLALATQSLSPTTGRPPALRPRSQRVGRALLFPFWVLALSALTTGTIEVLLPLRFNVLGVSAALIGVLFFASAALEAIASPFAGRLSDRIGRVRALDAIGTGCRPAFGLSRESGPWPGTRPSPLRPRRWSPPPPLIVSAPLPPRSSSSPAAANLCRSRFVRRRRCRCVICASSTPVPTLAQLRRAYGTPPPPLRNAHGGAPLYSKAPMSGAPVRP
jgi:MFS family permease